MPQSSCEHHTNIKGTYSISHAIIIKGTENQHPQIETHKFNLTENNKYECTRNTIILPSYMLEKKISDGKINLPVVQTKWICHSH